MRHFPLSYVGFFKLASKVDDSDRHVLIDVSHWAQTFFLGQKTFELVSDLTGPRWEQRLDSVNFGKQLRNMQGLSRRVEKLIVQLSGHASLFQNYVQHRKLGAFKIVEVFLKNCLGKQHLHKVEL